MQNTPRVEFIALSEEDLNVLLACLVFTRQRTIKLGWNRSCESMMARLFSVSKNFGKVNA